MLFRSSAVAFLSVFVEEFCQIEKVAPDTIALVAADVQGHAIRFDRSHLNQVMWNLARNALRYCRRQPGSVRIEVGLDSGNPSRVRIDVVDDGSGVPPEFRAHLFEPFFTTAANGTGLGLYIAREVCEANGASLDHIESENGCRFRISCSTP